MSSLIKFSSQQPTISHLCTGDAFKREMKDFNRSVSDITASINIYSKWLMLTQLLQLRVLRSHHFLSNLKTVKFIAGPCFCFDASETKVDHQPTDDQGFVSPPDNMLCN